MSATLYYLFVGWYNLGSVIVCVERERDWEKKVESTLVFAGFHKLHTNTFWGKRVADAD